jgi:membrane-bound lytic murein transglycosylase B
MKGTIQLAASVFAAMLFFSSFALAQPDNQAELARLRTLQDRFETLMVQFWRNGNDQTIRRQYLDAAVEYATAVMNSPALPPTEKYPKALRLYRRVLLHEPDNKVARENRQMIEDIYRSMNRPIPT